MIAGDVDDARAVLRLAEDRADDVVVRLRPEERLLQAPQIDDVADQVERVGLDERRKSSRYSALQPRKPRWTSEMKTRAKSEDGAGSDSGSCMHTVWPEMARRVRAVHE